MTSQGHTKKTQRSEEENTNTHSSDNTSAGLKMRILFPRRVGKRVAQWFESNPTEKIAKSYEIGTCSCGLKYLISNSQTNIQRLAIEAKSAHDAAKQ